MGIWFFCFGLAGVAAGGTWPEFFFVLSPSWDDARWRDELVRTGGSVETLRAGEDQALSRMLLDSRWLETLNHFGQAPRLADGRFDPAPFGEALHLRRHDFEAWATLPAGGAGTRYVLLRLAVPVDVGSDACGWSSRRLRRLKESLSALSPCDLRAIEKDGYGNAFAWEGRHPNGWRVWAWYRPEEDELRLLLAAGATSAASAGGATAPPATAPAPRS